MKTSLYIFLICAINSMFGQQTVGLFLNDEASFNGYTLFSPDYSTYLINNCGELVNKWTSDYKSSVSVYLLEDGDLLRTSRVSASSFGSGGANGRIERFSWDGDLEWTYIYSDELYQAHHDIEPMPNGNILILAWENRTASEAIAKGRSNGTALWPDRVVEVQPIDNNVGQIVWTWSAWDHLIQNLDPSLDNYGVVADHPGLFDINLIPEGGDWLHCNSVDYNEERDEIILSSRHFSEVFIIDHSTTTEEASSHEGGNSGKGGDILYRWGNPSNYDRGSFLDQQLFGNHDARWIEHGVNEGKIMVFNNSNVSNDGLYSTVDVIEPTIVADSYFLENAAAFEPLEAEWKYEADPLTSFYTGKQSGATRLPNENTLITDSGAGRIFEVNLEGNVVWDYQNPVNTIGGPATQGEAVSNSNIFRALRYAPSFEGFVGKDLTPTGLIEIDDNPAPCTIYIAPNGLAEQPIMDEGLNLLSNIVNTDLFIENKERNNYEWNISSINGTSLYKGSFKSTQEAIDVSNLPQGIFFITFHNKLSSSYSTMKFIKL